MQSIDITTTDTSIHIAEPADVVETTGTLTLTEWTPESFMEEQELLIAATPQITAQLKPAMVLATEAAASYQGPTSVEDMTLDMPLNATAEDLSAALFAKIVSGGLLAMDRDLVAV